METRLPSEIIYETPSLVPISDVIESLRGTQRLAEEIGPILETLIPGLEVTTITVTVIEIGQASPLREAFAFGLVGLFQDKIGSDMPKIIQDLFGVHMPSEYNNVVSLLFIVLVFYSGAFVYSHAKDVAERPRIKRQLHGLISDVAKMLEVSEDAIEHVLRERYAKGRVRALLEAGRRLIAPSKNQANAPMSINGRRLEREVVAEFPSDAQAAAQEPGPTTMPMENVEIHLHAQDIDHNKQGWAAVIPKLSDRRIRMQLYPPIKPMDIYTRQSVHGDILVEMRHGENGKQEPVCAHLIRLRE